MMNTKQRWFEAAKLAVLGIATFTALALLAGCERIVYRDNPAAPAPVPAVEATPPPSFRFPQGVPESEMLFLPSTPTLHDVVNEETAAMFPGCQIFTICDGLGYDPVSFFKMLAARLWARGLWAGQDREWERDELLVSRDCRTWEAFHQWYYGGRPMWAAVPPSPCYGDHCRSTSYRGNAVIPERYCR